MSVRDDARQEAERRWPSYPTVGFSGASDRQQAFIDGAIWAREQADREPSDAEVEAAADAIVEASFGQELPEAPIDLARAALIAAQEVRRG